MEEATKSIRMAIEPGYQKTRQEMAGTMKRVAYLSMEFLLGRGLRNAASNAGLSDRVGAHLEAHGHLLEDLFEQEADAALGNGGLGRLAACFMDSLASLRYPAVGYGLRYEHGLFRQEIRDGQQAECLDLWLPSHGGPHALEVYHASRRYVVHFGGQVGSDGVWNPAESVSATAYDQMVPGYATECTLPIRLWRSGPTGAPLDLAAFNEGRYEEASAQADRAQDLVRVLYPADHHERGKALRLRQQYLLVSASLQDIVHDFRASRKAPIATAGDWSALADYVAIQLNDTHPTLAIPELMRLLVHAEGLPWPQAWGLCQKVFGYTNHTVLPEALERWPVSLLNAVLPMHLDLILRINHFFLEALRSGHPELDESAIQRLSMVEEGEVQMVRMAHLAIAGSHVVNGVAAIHSRILVDDVFPLHASLWPGKFQNKTNGVTVRRWIQQANPQLAGCLSQWLGSDDWVRNFDALAALEGWLSDAEQHQHAQKAAKQLMAVKMARKKEAARLLAQWTGAPRPVRADSMFVMQAKRIHEYKRQLLNIFGVMDRYLQIKATARADRAERFVPRTVVFAGKAAPGYFMAKLVVRLILAVAHVVEQDPDMHGLLQVLFVPNYSVSMAEALIPAADLSEQISTAGMEASGTGNMKFVMNGALILGTLDGANVEIAEAVGSENIFIFGAKAHEVAALRKNYRTHDMAVPLDRSTWSPRYNAVLDTLEAGRFGDPAVFEPLVYHLCRNDFYLLAHDFDDYLAAQDRADALFRQTDRWALAQLANVLRSFSFSSDRTIRQYAADIWDIQPLENLA